MDKIKSINLIVCILFLSFCAFFLNYKIQNQREVSQIHQQQKSKIESMKNEINRKKFSKIHSKIFEQNSDLTSEIKNILKKHSVNDVKFKIFDETRFEIKFTTFDETQIYSTIDAIRSKLAGIIEIEKLEITDSHKEGLFADCKFRIFYPSIGLKDSVQVKEIPSRRYEQLFHKNKKRYKLNGIVHNKIAYINGEAFGKNDSIGDSRITDIFETSINIETNGTKKSINIDESW